MDDELRLLVRRELGVAAAEVVRIDHGWDSIAFDVDDAWIVRVPRRAKVRDRLLQEAKLLPLLADDLPVPIPAVRLLSDSAALVAAAHPKLEGSPIDRVLSADNAETLAAVLGCFLAALHGSSAHIRAGFPEVTDVEWVQSVAEFVHQCDAVLGMLDRDERRRAQSMFARQLEAAPDCGLALIHSDLGPDHILCRDGAVVGVIDWTDARVGDPALDFAWLLHAPDTPFAEWLLDAYGEAGGRIDPSLPERALYFHRLGPWHEVLWGLGNGRDELVESGLAGVRARLP